MRAECGLIRCIVCKTDLWKYRWHFVCRLAAVVGGRSRHESCKLPLPARRLSKSNWLYIKYKYKILDFCSQRAQLCGCGSDLSHITKVSRIKIFWGIAGTTFFRDWMPFLMSNIVLCLFLKGLYYMLYLQASKLVLGWVELHSFCAGVRASCVRRWMNWTWVTSSTAASTWPALPSSTRRRLAIRRHRGTGREGIPTTGSATGDDLPYVRRTFRI